MNADDRTGFNPEKKTLPFAGRASAGGGIHFSQLQQAFAVEHAAEGEEDAQGPQRDNAHAIEDDAVRPQVGIEIGGGFKGFEKEVVGRVGQRIAIYFYFR